jgi:hypothetical protein
MVGKYGTSLEKQQIAMLRRELERAVAKGDNKAVQRACSEIEGLRWRVLGKQDWFWREIFDSLRQADTPFIDMAEAQKLFANGQSAISSGNGEVLREVVRDLWKHQPKGQAELIWSPEVLENNDRAETNSPDRLFFSRLACCHKSTPLR